MLLFSGVTYAYSFVFQVVVLSVTFTLQKPPLLFFFLTLPSPVLFSIVNPLTVSRYVLFSRLYSCVPLSLCLAPSSSILKSYNTRFVVSAQARHLFCSVFVYLFVLSGFCGVILCSGLSGEWNE